MNMERIRELARVAATLKYEDGHTPDSRERAKEKAKLKRVSNRIGKERK